MASQPTAARYVPTPNSLPRFSPPRRGSSPLSCSCSMMSDGAPWYSMNSFASTPADTQHDARSVIETRADWREVSPAALNLQLGSVGAPSILWTRSASTSSSWSAAPRSALLPG